MRFQQLKHLNKKCREEKTAAWDEANQSVTCIEKGAQREEEGRRKKNADWTESKAEYVTRIDAGQLRTFHKSDRIFSAYFHKFCRFGVSIAKEKSCLSPMVSRGPPL